MRGEVARWSRAFHAQPESCVVRCGEPLGNNTLSRSQRLPLCQRVMCKGMKVQRKSMNTYRCACMHACVRTSTHTRMHPKQNTVNCRHARARAGMVRGARHLNVAHHDVGIAARPARQRQRAGITVPRNARKLSNRLPDMTQCIYRQPQAHAVRCGPHWSLASRTPPKSQLRDSPGKTSTTPPPGVASSPHGLWPIPRARRGVKRREAASALPGGLWVAWPCGRRRSVRVIRGRACSARGGGSGSGPARWPPACDEHGACALALGGWRLVRHPSVCAFGRGRPLISRGRNCRPA